MSTCRIFVGGSMLTIQQAVEHAIAGNAAPSPALDLPWTMHMAIDLTTLVDAGTGLPDAAKVKAIDDLLDVIKNIPVSVVARSTG